MKSRRSTDSNDFPYTSKAVCYFELTDGVIEQLSSKDEKVSAYFRAARGDSKIYAVWPGNWRSDLFEIDDLDSFAKANGIKVS